MTSLFNKNPKTTFLGPHAPGIYANKLNSITTSPPGKYADMSQARPGQLMNGALKGAASQLLGGIPAMLSGMMGKSKSQQTTVEEPMIQPKRRIFNFK